MKMYSKGVINDTIYMNCELMETTSGYHIQHLLQVNIQFALKSKYQQWRYHNCLCVLMGEDNDEEPLRVTNNSLWNIQ